MKHELIEFLKGGSAHVKTADALANITPAIRNTPAPGHPDKRTLWQLLEHLRIAQEDIIRFTFDEGWESPEFPDGYWPTKAECNEQEWETSLNAFLGDLNYLIRFVENADLDFTEVIPHGDGRTYLREILLVADHNAYHIAQVVELRKRLGDWK